MAGESALTHGSIASESTNVPTYTDGQKPGASESPAGTALAAAASAGSSSKSRRGAPPRVPPLAWRLFACSVAGSACGDVGVG